MVRFSAVFVLVLVPGFLLAEEEKPKPAYLGIQIKAGAEEGTIIIQVVLNKSPAEKAGLKSGDRIVRIDGVKPANLRATVQVVKSLKPGKKVKLLIERDGKEKTIEATPGTLDE